MTSCETRPVASRSSRTGAERDACRRPTPGPAPRRSLGHRPAASRSHQAGSTPGVGERRGQRPRVVDAVVVEPLGQPLLGVGSGQRVGYGGPPRQIAAQARRGPGTGRRRCPRGRGRRARRAARRRSLEGVDGADRRGRRVVELVGEAGRERAEGDQGVALADGRLDGAGGGREPADQVHSEREPLLHQLAERRRRHPQQAADVDTATGGEVGAVGVPGPEPAGPAPGHVHPADEGVLRPTWRSSSTCRRPAPTRRRRARPRGRASPPGSIATISAPATSSPSCSSVRPRKRSRPKCSTAPPAWRHQVAAR